MVSLKSVCRCNNQICRRTLYHVNRVNVKTTFFCSSSYVRLNIDVICSVIMSVYITTICKIHTNDHITRNIILTSYFVLLVVLWHRHFLKNEILPANF